MRTRTKILSAATLVAALAAGGSAFTAANTLPAGATVGYGTETVTGATVTDITYALNADGTKIASETLTFTGNLTTATVMVGWGSADLTECDGDKANSTYSSPSTTMTCTDGNESTTAATSFVVAVTH